MGCCGKSSAARGKSRRFKKGEKDKNYKKASLKKIIPKK
jgi:hypothetical protein